MNLTTGQLPTGSVTETIDTLNPTASARTNSNTTISPDSDIRIAPPGKTRKPITHRNNTLNELKAPLLNRLSQMKYIPTLQARV
jgi:hypothetical protein